MAGRRKGKRVVRGDGAVEVLGRNANGEGSVYQTKDGRWVATWPIPGRRCIRGKATAKTRDEAILKRTKKMAEAVTVGELADEWLEDVAQPSVRPPTLVAYGSHVKRIKATLGDVGVTVLDAGMVTA